MDIFNLSFVQGTSNSSKHIYSPGKTSITHKIRLKPINGLQPLRRRTKLFVSLTLKGLGSIFQDALHSAQDQEPRAQFTLQANRRDATTLPKLRVLRTIRRQSDE